MGALVGGTVLQGHRATGLEANGKGGQRKELLVPRYPGNLLENKKGTCLNLGWAQG